jgi:hypothetical protein
VLHRPVETAPFSGKIGYSESMNPDLATDKANIESLISLWQEEEKRLRLTLEDPNTSPSIKHQVSERLASVLDQIQGLADESEALKQTN